MKCLTILIAMYFIMIQTVNAQEGKDANAIKLFLDNSLVDDVSETLNPAQKERLFSRITQLINQTGIVEIGYSTFLVFPKFDVLTTSVSETGMSQIHLAECELTILIKRAEYGGYGGATFNSFSKRLTGTGSSKNDAINNALNNISVSRDRSVVDFFNNSRQKIDAYFKANCNSVIKEAEQALDLKQYGKSIALYFSIPSSAPCYDKAYAASKKVYVTFVEDECNKKLVLLKSYVALAQNQNNNYKNYYDSAMNIMRALSPSSDKCYAEAKLQIEKIEQRLDEAQKREWELTKKLSGDEADVKKEMYKAMGKISANYQPPPPATNVIIAH